MAKELATACPGRPLGELLAILDVRVKDAGGATPDRQAPDVATVGSHRAGEEFNRRGAVAGSGKMIPETDGMLKGEGPQSEVVGARPREDGVHHHGASPGSDCLEGTLSNSILVMGAGAGVAHHLIVGSKVALEGLRVEGSIASSMALDGMAMAGSKLLKGLDATEGLPGVQRNLVPEEDKRCGMAGSGGATMAALMLGFAATGVGQAARDRRDELAG